MLFLSKPALEMFIHVFVDDAEACAYNEARINQIKLINETNS